MSSKRAREQEQKPSTSLVLAEFEGLPPSINDIYSTSKQGIRFMTKAGKVFKRYVEDTMADALAGCVLDDDILWYELVVTFYIPLFYKKGTRRRWDVTNHLKSLEDSVVKAAGVDDCIFIRVIASKVDIGHDEPRRTTIMIREADGSADAQ